MSQREEFERYVVDVAKVQRRTISDRVEKLVTHESKAWHYFLGCIAGSLCTTVAVFKVWGPRHILKHSHFYIRPIPPALCIGFTLYGLLYTCRLMAMRTRVWSLIDDYEYELKRVKAHHVAKGVEQLAWLQFVAEELRQGGENKFDFEKLKSM